MSILYEELKSLTGENIMSSFLGEENLAKLIYAQKEHDKWVREQYSNDNSEPEVDLEYTEYTLEPCEVLEEIRF
jgi:hypothetical protein